MIEKLEELIKEKMEFVVKEMNTPNSIFTNNQYTLGIIEGFEIVLRNIEKLKDSDIKWKQQSKI